MPVTVRTNFKNLKLRLREKAREATTGKKLLNRIGFIVTRDIKANVRLGILKFKALSRATIDSRFNIARWNRTSNFYRLTRSNLHITGELVDSIDYRVRNKGVVIEPTGTHSSYNTSKGAGKGRGISNKRIAKMQADAGRNIFQLRDETKEKVFVEIERALRRALRK